METRTVEKSSVRRNGLLKRPPQTSISRSLSLAEHRPKKEDLAVQVEFSLVDNKAHAVAVAGSFNHWDSRKTPLQKHGSCWTGMVSLPRGRYEYRFVVDGKWVSDPNARESIGNPFGGINSVLTV